MTVHLIHDLEVLHHDILAMCANVEQMVNEAVDALGHPDDEVAERLATKDDEIDRWDVRIEEECLKILALHQPVAIDLRRITTVMKLSGELERVADLAVHIAERATGFLGHPRLRIPDRLTQMSRISLDMLHRSIESYVELDSVMARQVCGDDEEVDQLNGAIIDELARTMQASPDLVEPTLHLFSASRHIERVADHATNIAEDVVYLVEGEIIRHRAGASDTVNSSSG